MTMLQAPSRPVTATWPAIGLPIALLVEPSVEVAASILQTLEDQGFEVTVARDLPTTLAMASFVLVEADRGAQAVSLIKRIHALYPELPIVGVMPWWDDDEAEILRITRFILHVPVRDDQLRGLAELAASMLPA